MIDRFGRNIIKEEIEQDIFKYSTGGIEILSPDDDENVLNTFNIMAPEGWSE